MSIIDVRLANLEALAGKYRTAKDFCAAAGIQPSYLSQLRSQGKTLGNALARDIETRLELEPGFLDVDHGRSAPPKGAAGLADDVASAAFALQGMTPELRRPFIRLILSTAAATLGHKEQDVDNTPLALPFEVTNAKAPVHSEGVPVSKTAKGRHGR